MKKLIFSLVLTFILIDLNGCTSTKNLNHTLYSKNSLKQITLLPEYVDKKKNKLKLTTNPKNFLLAMPLIPGSIMGEIKTKSIMAFEGLVGKPLHIDLQKDIQVVSSFASPMLTTQFTRGISIEPSSAKLVRVGTFAINAKSGEIIGGTGVGVSTKPQSGLILIYFDRPAVIKGVNLTNNYQTSVHLEAKSSGYIWAEVTEVDDSHIIVTNRKTEGNEMLYIIIEDNFLI